MDLLILAGGFGTRLKPVLYDIPKVLAPVDDNPFIYHQIENWVRQGINSFVFLLYNQSHYIIKYLEEVIKIKYKNCNIKWIIEDLPLDTGGAVANAIKQLDFKKNFLLTNADTWIDGGIEKIRSSDYPSIGVIKKNDARRYGNIVFDSNFIIQKFEEKSKIKQQCWINAGLYHLHSDLFNNWHGLPFSLENSFFSDCIKNKILRAVPFSGDFIDIGIPEDYSKFCKWNGLGRRGLL